MGDVPLYIVCHRMVFVSSSSSRARLLLHIGSELSFIPSVVILILIQDMDPDAEIMESLKNVRSFNYLPGTYFSPPSNVNHLNSL